MKKILLKNGQIVRGREVIEGDILIENGKISQVGIVNDSAGAEVVDCKGKVILPGVIDVHVHFREPGASHKEDWETGSKAAVSGGVTTVFDMPNNKPPIISNVDLRKKRELINGKTYCNYGLYMACDGKNFDEIAKAKNIPGVKVYIAHSTGDMGVGMNALESIFKNVDKKIVIHAEDEEIIEKNKERYRDLIEAGEPSVHSKVRSKEAAIKAVQTVCELAEKYKKPVHIAHVSTEEEVEIINRYKKYGVTCEVTPHHLMFSEDDYVGLGNLIKVNPPIRGSADLFALWKALKFGEIDMVATDHAPHTLGEKALPYKDCPSGMPGVETLLPIFLNAVNTDALTLVEVAYFLSEHPAEIFGAEGKGKIEKGFDADLVVVDMEKEKKVDNKKIFSKCAWSPYNGLSFKGWPIMTFVNGEMVFKSGKIVGEPIGKEILFKN